MKLLFGQDDLVAELVASNLGMVISPPFVAVGIVDRNGVISGGFVFNHFNGFNLEVSAYGPGLMKRGIIRAVMHYAFVQSNALRLTARTRRGNTNMRKILPRMGFEFEGISREMYGPGKENDAINFRMTRPMAVAAKWIGE